MNIVFQSTRGMVMVAVVAAFCTAVFARGQD